MSLRTLFFILLLMAAAQWAWQQYQTQEQSTRLPAAAQAYCPLPPAVHAGQEPLQSGLRNAPPLLQWGQAVMTPLAGFSIDARVLSRRDYHSGREADFSPTDLALGWGPMRDPAVLSRLDISQSGRWYRYRWEGQSPIPQRDIALNSANMHLIPASQEVARALANVAVQDNVRIEGWLVAIEAEDGWRWRSSTTRSDSGGGACEVIYVCALSRY